MDLLSCICSVVCFIWTNLRPSVDGAVRDAGEAGRSSLGNWCGDLRRFRRNVGILNGEMDELRRTRSELEGEVASQEANGEVKRTDPVEKWLREVQKLDGAVAEFYSAASSDGCPWSLGFSGCLCSPRKLDDLKWKVGELKKQKGNLGMLVEPVPVVEIAGASVDPTILASRVKEILEQLKVKNKVGIYGMCGVGKTELLKAVNNHLFRSSRKAAPQLPFHIVIYVNLNENGQDGLNSRKEQNKLAIQRQIRRRLRLSSSEDVSNVLSCKKTCLLLVDDVWDVLDWNEIGISSPNEKLKVVFTAPSISVCEDMKAAGVRVDFLSEEDSWQLFCMKMAEKNKRSWDECSPRVKGLAEKVVSMCGGLPRAIIAIPGGLALNFSNVEAWELIEEQLKHSPHKVAGMAHLFSSLKKRCFDPLEQTPLKVAECLLYCSLFPESQNINKEQIIDYWIGEGFLEEGQTKKLQFVRKEGNQVIDRLQKACLLESGHWDQHELKLHHIVRQMALWLTHDDTNKFLTSTRLELSDDAYAANSWKKAMRISLMDTDDKDLPGLKSEKCSNLRTLLLNKHDLDPYQDSRCKIDRDALGVLFKLLPALRVLDLSGTNITELPPSISSLIGLKYLNMSHTDITSLPKELKELVELRLLIVRNTPYLSRIPQEAISLLNKLQILDFYCSSYEWSWTERFYQVRDGDNILQERQASLADLVHVSLSTSSLEFGINIKTLPDLLGLVGGTVSFDPSNSFERSFKSTTLLSLDGVDDLTTKGLEPVFSTMRMLLQLSITRCPKLDTLSFGLKELQKLKVLSLRDLPLSRIEAKPQRGNDYPLKDLQNLHIRLCHQLTELTCVKNFPSLQKISLTSCDGIQELIASPSAVDDTSLSELRKISLVDLRSFTRFSSQPLCLPSLEHITVSGSPNLKKLPLGPTNRRKMKEICGEQTWWNELEWDPDGNADFRHCFKALTSDS